MSTINITATTNETTVSASATAITVSAADSSTTLSPTTVLAAYNAGTGLTLSGTTFNVDAAQTQITSVGTLTSLTSGTITSNATKLDLTDATTNSSSVYGPTIELYRNGGDGDASSTNIVNSDKLGTIDFYGNNDAGTPEKIKYAKIFTSIYEETDGAESGRLSFSVINAGTHTEGVNPASILDLEPDVAVFKQDVRIQAAASGGVQATSTPILELYQEDGPAADDGDHLGEIQFTAYNDNGFSPAKHKYAGIHAEIIDESNATEDGSLHFTCVKAGTEDTTVLTLNGSGSTLFSDLIAPLTIRSTTTSADLVIVNGDDSADSSPIIELYRSQSQGADGEDLGKIEFYASNDRGFSSGGPEKILYGSLSVEISDASDGTEDGALKYSKVVGGSQQTGDLVTQPNNGGVQFPAQSAAPSSPANGQVYYDTDDHKLKVYANGGWVDLH